MQKQKVFIPVTANDLKYDNIYDVIFPSKKRKNPEVSLVKEQEGYFFTPEELKELVAECVGFVWGRYGTEKDREEQCKKLIESLNIK